VRFSIICKHQERRETEVSIGVFPQYLIGTYFTGISRLLQIKQHLVGACVYDLREYAERLFLSLPQIFWLVEWKGHVFGLMA
jgi:hypothetical protein